MHRRRFALVSVLAILSIAAASCVPPGPQAPSPDSESGPNRPALAIFAAADAAQFASFEAWVGRPLDAKKFNLLKNGGWAKWAAPGWLNHFSGQQVAVNAMPFPDGVGGSLANAGAGAYDAYYATLARNLIANGYSDADIVIGHEFNGNWFAWSAAYGKHTDFVNAFRRMVTVFRAQPGAAFRFNWVLAKGSHQMPDPTMAYPGDAYVDVIGMDLYDNDSLIRRSDGGDWAQRRWQKFLTMPFGLNWLADFAAAHGKPISFPEWGLSTPETTNNVGGGDNPYYVEQFHAWVTANNVVYHSYHNVSASDGEHRLQSGKFPDASATYRRLFGN